MKPVTATKNDLPELVRLGGLLWPELSKEDLERTFIETFERSHEITFAINGEEGQLAGMAIFSIRSDYVEGARNTPVGYLEAIIVDEPCRGKGYAKSLLDHGISWCQSMGCQQVGSDVEIDNITSQQFHSRNRFRETNRIVTYILDI